MLAARSAAETSSGTIFMESSNSPMIFVSRALLAPESISNRVITVVHKLPLSSSRATRSAAGSRPARKSIRTSVSARVIANSCGFGSSLSRDVLLALVTDCREASAPFADLMLRDPVPPNIAQLLRIQCGKIPSLSCVRPTRLAGPDARQQFQWWFSSPLQYSCHACACEGVHLRMLISDVRLGTASPRRTVDHRLVVITCV